MEWVFALIATSLTVGYAVLLGRGIERRQRWALEIARAMGGLDACAAERLFRDQSVAHAAAEAVDQTSSAPVVDRLAA
jgi:hypothetical protein